MNLDLGIETCFYNSSKSTPSTCLPSLLVSSNVIILSKYFDSFSKLLSNRNPVAALGTLVLLSYSKFLRFIVAALQNMVLDYPDGSTKTVWLFDGNVQYFTPKHIPQFVAAIIILIAGGLFTVLLFFGQWFPRCSKVMIWTKNTLLHWLHGCIPCSIHSQASLLGGTAPLCSDCSKSSSCHGSRHFSPCAVIWLCCSWTNITEQPSVQKAT